MRRTEAEFRQEVLYRSSNYIKMRKLHIRRIMTAVSAAAAVCVIATACLWGMGINGRKKTTCSKPENLVESEGLESGSKADIVSILVRVQEGNKEVSRCYSNREKISKMTVMLQEMERLKKEQEEMKKHIQEIIDKMQAELDRNQSSTAEDISKESEETQNEAGSSTGCDRSYSISVTREDGSITYYTIAGMDAKYYEMKNNIELSQQYMDRLQKLIESMPTD